MSPAVNCFPIHMSFLFALLQRLNTNHQTSLSLALRPHTRNRCCEAELKDYTHHKRKGKSLVGEFISAIQGNHEYTAEERAETKSDSSRTVKICKSVYFTR